MGGVVHQTVIAYLRGNIGSDEKHKIQKWQDEDPTGRLFFELIDGVKARTQVLQRVDANQELPASHASAEDLLLRILSENAEPEERQRFMNAILFSPVFYQRTLAMLATSQREALDEVPEVAHIQVVSDEEILSKVISGVSDRPTAGVTEMRSGHTGSSSRKRRSLFNVFGRVPGLAYVVPLVAVIIAVIILGLPSQQGEAYVYDDAVPYDPDSSSFRSATAAARAGSLGPYVDRFDQGISEYLARNYATAIRIFTSLEAALRADKQRASLQRVEAEFLANYHLYSGLSYFALWRTARDLEENSRVEYTREAITHLTQSYEWAERQEFVDKDALVYFLGLAHGLSGNEAVAVPYLSEVTPASDFYSDATKRIADWSP